MVLVLESKVAWVAAVDAVELLWAFAVCVAAQRQISKAAEAVAGFSSASEVRSVLQLTLPQCAWAQALALPKDTAVLSLT
jgi:hypothetical protein